MPEETPSPAEGVAPKSQFRLEQFVVRRVLFEEVARAPRAEGEEPPSRIKSTIQITASIQAIPESIRAIVTLAVTVTPDVKWQPYRLEVTIAGAFSGENVTPEQFDRFCRIGVPPILFPYVREIVHHVTMDAPYGAIKIDPINIAEMLSQATWVQTEMRDVQEQPTASTEP